MGWKATGAERGKSYAVYKDLESRYQTALDELAAVKDELELKNETIRSLARELALHGPITMQRVEQVPASTESVRAMPEESVRLADMKASGVAPRPPVKASKSDVPLSELMRKAK